MDDLFFSIKNKITRDSGIRAALLFGSRAQGSEKHNSDFDIQIVSRGVHGFIAGQWFESAELGHLVAFYAKPATEGAIKITALFRRGTVDMVVVQLYRMLIARLAVNFGLHRRSARLHKSLSALSVVIRPGYKLLKGGSGWEKFYALIVRDVPVPRLSNEDVRRVAMSSYIDALWVAKKAKDGEFLAAHRWLYRVPFDANLILLNELRMRMRVPPCYDARHAEEMLNESELALIKLETGLDENTLLVASRHCVESTKILVEKLTGTRPCWPSF